MKPSDVAAAIRNTRFTPRIRIRGGYATGEVDAFLDELEATARRGGDLGAAVRARQFTTVKWQEAYDTGEVDRFLAEMAGTELDPQSADDVVPVSAASGSAWAIRSLVERARFTPVRLREGYDMADVDALLDRVVAAAERGDPVAPMIDRARFTPVRLREGYDMGEVDRLLEQLKGAAPAVTDPGVVQERPGLLDRLRGRR